MPRIRIPDDWEPIRLMGQLIAALVLLCWVANDSGRPFVFFSSPWALAGSVLFLGVSVMTELTPPAVEDELAPDRTLSLSPEGRPLRRVAAPETWSVFGITLTTRRVSHLICAVSCLVATYSLWLGVAALFIGYAALQGATLIEGVRRLRRLNRPEGIRIQRD